MENSISTTYKLFEITKIDTVKVIQRHTDIL